jgi:hypothetical protein
MDQRLRRVCSEIASGTTRSAIRWRQQRGDWFRVVQGVYAVGPQPVSTFERASAVVLATNAVAIGTLAGQLHQLDGIDLVPPFGKSPKASRHQEILRGDPNGATELISGIACLAPLETLIDLSGRVDELVWEQALESALRKRLCSVDGLLVCVGTHPGGRGTGRMKRVLAARPMGVPPTESILETLMVQLIRTDPTIPCPLRQVEVWNSGGSLVGRADLAWPDLGVFIELDGMQHLDQRLYDSRRQTAIVAATGWLPGRFTWAEVTRVPKTTLKRVAELLDRARHHP